MSTSGSFFFSLVDGFDISLPCLSLCFVLDACFLQYESGSRAEQSKAECDSHTASELENSELIINAHDVQADIN